MAAGSHKTIGLAGGIGAGKSTVARILADLGCLVVDSDALGREALGDPAIRDTLVGWWGQGILDAQGRIDRAAVARIVFSSPQQRKRIESIVHPWIEARRRVMFEQAAHDHERDTPALVIDAPLLFEAGVDKQCDVVLFVEAGRDTRLARLASSRGWDGEQVSKREESQLALDEKRTRSDIVITNNGDLRALTEQVRRALYEIVQPRRS